MRRILLAIVGALLLIAGVVWTCRASATSKAA